MGWNLKVKLILLYPELIYPVTNFDYEHLYFYPTQWSKSRVELGSWKHKVTKNIVIPFRWDVSLLQVTRPQFVLVKPTIRQFIVSRGRALRSVCPLRTKQIDSVPSLTLTIDYLFSLSLCPSFSQKSNVGDGFNVLVHHFVAGDAKCDLRKERVQTFIPIRWRYKEGGIRRVPIRTTVLVPKRTRSQRSQRQP